MNQFLYILDLIYYTMNQNDVQATSGVDVWVCYFDRIPPPLVQGVPTKTRLESSIKKSRFISESQPKTKFRLECRFCNKEV